MRSKNLPLNLVRRLWQYSRFALVLFACVLMTPQQAEASHSSGADIEYECIGNNQYVITLRLYRDCDGIALGATAGLNIFSDSCGIGINGGTGSLSFARDTFYEVSQLCPSAISQSSCNSTAAGALPGYEVHIYTDTVTFPQSCVDWRVSYSTCCRNGAITTGQSNASFYIEAMINSNYCNSSPTFSSLPTPYFCAGQSYQYNHGANDPEGDSLLYALTCPLTTGPGLCATYGAGFSATQPIATSPANSFGFNQFTGQMSFTPQNNTAQIGVAAVTVYNILNGDTIGYVQRDIQMVVLNSVNCTSPVTPSTPAVVQGGAFDTTSTSFVVCAGESLTFKITLSDPDGDTISLDPVNTNLDQVFGAGNWSPFISYPDPNRVDTLDLFITVNATPNLIGVNQITIGVTDNACPIPGNQILSYNVIIPGVEVTVRDTVICPGIAQQIQLTATSFSSVASTVSGTYQWTQISGVPITFSNDTILNPFVNVPGSTVDGDSIRLQLSFTTSPDPTTGNQCVTTDSVTIRLRALPLTVFAFASDTSLCPNFATDTISTMTAVFGPGIDLVSGIYSWTSTPANYVDSLSNPNINNPNIIASGGPGDTAVYTVTYAYGACIGSDDVLVYWRDGIPNVTASLDTVCPGDTVQLSAMLTDTITRANPSACSTYTVAPITYGLTSGTGTNVSLGDDQLSGALPIGFNFNFYCNNYSSFYISSNGYISFDAGAGAGCCTGDPIPAVATPNNIIALAWEDLNPNSGGTINYFTVGTAPNRQLVINYNAVSRFGGASTIGGQIVLFEGTNQIEIHTTSVQADGNTTQGIENSDGTIGVPVPGRSGQVWAATNDAYRFIPQAPLVFTPITYNWTPGFAVSDATASAPFSVPQGTTTFVAQVIQGDCVLEDSVEVAVRSVVAAPTVTCGTPANQATSVLFEWGMSGPLATGWEYSLDSGTTFIPRALADSFLLITGLTNGDCANILVRATGGLGRCPNNSATYLECCTTPCPPPYTTITTDLTCNSSNDGTVNIGIVGGVLGYHPNFAVTLFDTSGAVVANQNTADTARFTGLNANLYYAYIIDTLGCFVFTDTVTLTQPDTLILSLDTTTLTTCFADADGSATVSAIGGTTTYNFQWDAAANNQVGTVATGLTRGNYDVILTDANGCMDTLGVTVNSPFPALPSVTLNTTNSTSCAGNGTATVFTTLNLVGDANTFNYQWSAGAPLGSTVTSLPAGNYAVTVTDVNGCIAVNNFTITGSASVAITSFAPVNPGCNLNNGQATVVATGDNSGYVYQWSDGQVTALATGLGIGTYAVTVTGATNGCTAVDSVTLTNTNGVQIVGFNTANPTCGGSDGTATVQYVGASGLVNYQWSNGATTQSINSLPAGSYSVTVTDVSSNCADIADTILVQETIVTTITSSTNPNCNLTNGRATAITTGAVGPFSYAWSNGATTAAVQGLGTGTHYVTATYQGCTSVDSVTLNAESIQIAITDKDDITCNGDGDAYAYITTLNNSSAVTYQWTGPNGFTSNNDSISNLAAGSYTVVASVGTGCTVSQSITVVDVTLTTNAFVGVPSQKEATIQISEQIDINGGVVTNHFNPVFAWTEQNAGVADINDAADSATFVTGQIGTSSSQTWLYFNATAGPCSAMDSVLITVQSYLGMPTAFTPNGDGINDVYRPAGLTTYTKVIQFKIWNRFGQLMFDDATNPQWDGTYLGVAQARDVYIYVFEYVSDTGERIIVRGEFTLLR